MRHPILVSWSGGKDAAWTLQQLLLASEHEVVGLVTTVTEGYERIAMHGIRREILYAQSLAVGLPVIEARLPQRADNATYESAFAQALATARLRWSGIERIAFGDLHLADVKAYRDALCARLGWIPLYPLFGADPKTLAAEMLAGGLRATLCCVDTQQLNRRYVGREFDAEFLAELPASVDPCGENGEFHTCVHAGPMFTQPLQLTRSETVLRDERFAYCDLLPG